MQDEGIVGNLPGAVISTLFSPRNTLQRYAAPGIIVATLLFTVLFLKPRQVMPDTEIRGPRESSSEVQGASGPSSFFYKARNFVLNNAVFTYIQGEDKTPQIMKLLAKHTIIGAAHDDSERTYTPRCHPGTRIEILERLTAWFCNIRRAKSLLWLRGYAGVGKSAILQTFTESVKQPMASVFVSRPNKRNDPNRIFTTIAYQLAVHVGAYRSYIVDRLAANPYLLNKNMQIQFQVLIVEPFVEQKIGAGGHPSAILLDGLDEIDGIEAQRDIIRLISAFTQEHPDVPLAWIISSRPETHIVNTFNESSIRGRCETESIPMDSTDACKEVEFFLRAKFATVRREFPDPPLRNWPEETALVKLANASSGLFIFAETAVQFIRDPDFANPVERLPLVLSVIDDFQGTPIKGRPFALLDNLYAEILLNMAPELLSIARLLMKLVLFFRSADNPLGPFIRSKSRTLKGMIMILQLKHHTVYAALNKCCSMLRIPPWERAHKETLTFLHASFADYLMDSRRSGKFYIAVDDAEDQILLSYLNLWHKHFGENSNTAINLVDEHYNETQDVSSEEIDEFNASILEDMARTLLSQIIEKHKSRPAASPASQEKRLECLNSFQKVNMITLCNCKYLDNQESTFLRRTLFLFARKTFCDWKENTHDLRASGFLRQISFRDISFDPRDFEAGQGATPEQLQNRFGWPREGSIGTFSSQSPEVLICGMVPRGQVALIKVNNKGTKYYIVPYHEFSARDGTDPMSGGFPASHKTKRLLQ